MSSEGLGLDLNIIWFILVGILITGYAVLDGFDLGVGILHLFTSTDTERRLMLNSIGPVWDGNEVWLVTAGGALLAAFPVAYATVFSGFYLVFMALLAMLIFRAVAIEFRSKETWPWWRTTWDIAFALSSFFAAFLLGTAVGNIALGVPLGGDFTYKGTLLNLLNPYALLIGVMTVLLFAMHGSIYIIMKTEGELNAKMRSWTLYTIPLFVIIYFVTTMVTLLYVPQMTTQFRAHPELSVIGLLNLLAIANIPRELYHHHDFRAFFSSVVAIIFLMMLFGIGIFPYLVPSSTGSAFGLTIYNAASSQKTLGIMLLIAVLGMPLVFSYTASVYWIFRGKVRLTAKSY
jgi:cytochrome d ubiquinol oxidase subunit II